MHMHEQESLLSEGLHCRLFCMLYLAFIHQVGIRSRMPGWLLYLKFSTFKRPFCSRATVYFRIQFKILLLVFRSLDGMVQSYSSKLLQPHTLARALRSTNQLLLDISRQRLKNRSNRAFSMAAPYLWNGSPLHIRAAQTLDNLNRQLKIQVCLWLLVLVNIFAF